MTAKKWALVFGVIFVLAGILGFIPNPILGEGAYFHADGIHSVIHLIIGIVLLVAGSKSDAGAAKTIKVIAIIYLLLAIVGFIQLGAAGNEGMLLGIAGSNSADNWFHLVVAVVMLLAGKKSGGATM